MILLAKVKEDPCINTTVAWIHGEARFALSSQRQVESLIRQCAFSRVVVAELLAGSDGIDSPRVATQDAGDYCALVLADDDEVLVEFADGRELVCGAKGVCVVGLDEPFTLKSESGVKVLLMCLPRGVLSTRLSEPHKVSDRVVRVQDKSYFVLLTGYLTAVLQFAAIANEMAAELAEQHLIDLAVNLLSIEPGEIDVPSLQGKMNARLTSIRQYMRENIQNSGLSVESVALHHNISPHYVRKLFYEAGLSFSAYLCELRLAWVYEKLCSREWATESISKLAFNAGFNNLAWFNRRFKKRFGLTPSEVRGVLEDCGELYRSQRK